MLPMDCSPVVLWEDSHIELYAAVEIRDVHLGMKGGAEWGREEKRETGEEERDGERGRECE